MGQLINVLNFDGTLRAVQAECVDLVPEYAAYVWQKRRDEWKVIDSVSGGVLATRETRADAVAAATELVKRHGLDKVLAKSVEYVNKYGRAE